MSEELIPKELIQHIPIFPSILSRNVEMMKNNIVRSMAIPREYFSYDQKTDNKIECITYNMKYWSPVYLTKIKYEMRVKAFKLTAITWLEILDE